MKPIPLLFTLLSLISQILPAQTPSEAEQIAATIQAGPEELRADATVLGYNEKNEIIALRKGTNDLVCLANDPSIAGFKAVCYHSSLADFMTRGRELKAEGKNRKEIEEIRSKEAKAGTLNMPKQPATLHVLYGKEAKYNSTTGLVENAQLRYVVYIPWATQESTGLPLKPMVPGGPWIMFPGTYNAHIMITPPTK
ncbi:hypothetical protein N7E81_12720 [Reichenbachiella carrageenanivorans]|uniref:Uncharacterized protein n=1 Tax=Reichenbachiella carrageenanivorans TaxID=2979869 RepID=A0ABY6CWD6_9BACT|nr:hypothetical protein [Reichenbachiella carrageenanivorans]UXX78220.1 hypothetical protein N7E81_12720 [Reichenbachiella carrageenanivorans]